MLIRPREERDAYAGFIARRFLRARQQGFLSLISLLSALGFLLGVASLIIALALMTGFQSDVIDRIIGSNAHLLVFAEDGTVIDDPEPLIAQLGQIDGVAACEPVVHGYGGLVAAGQRVQWTSISGIDAERPAAVTRLHESMQHGSLEDLTKTTASGRPAIVLGEQLAAQLGALPGDTVRLMIPRPRLTPWGVSVRQKFLEVVGTFRSGFFDYDSSWSFVSLETGRELFDVGPGCHWIAVRLDDLDELASVERAILDRLGPTYLVDDILRQNKPYFSALRLEKLLMSLAIGLIVLVAALGVISTLVLTVTQKIKIIGVLAALGATPGGIQKIFLLQGLAMGLLGTTAGALLGVGLCWYLDRFGVIRLDPEVYLLDHLPFVVELRDLLLVVGAAALVALLATLYPAWRASRLDPVEALRRE